MKKLLALLMALVMLFALCACGNGGKDDDDKNGGLSAKKLEGDWEMSISLNALLDSGAMDDLSEMIEMMDLDDLDLTLETDVSFEDGKLEIDPDGMVDFYEDLTDAMLDWMAEGDNVYEMIAASSGDMSAAEYKAALEAQGLTKDGVLDMIESELADSDELADELIDEMGDLRYELDGDKLYTWNADEDEEKDEDSYFQFTYEDDTITVTKVVEDDETTKLDDGDFVFEKK